MSQTWNEVINSEEYQTAPFIGRVGIKRKYWRDVIQKSEKYKTFSKEKKQKVRSEFLTPDKKEKLQIKEFLSKPRANVPFVKAMEIGGKAVEAFAHFIEPKSVPPNRTMVGLVLKDATRQGIADYLRFYKPWNLLATNMTGKALQKIAPSVGRGIAKVTPERIKAPMRRFFTVGKGQPVAYQALKERNILAREAGGREAQDVAKILSTKSTGELLTQQEQQYLGRIFRKETIESPILKAHPRYKELKAISDEGRKVIDKWSIDLANSGIPKEQAKKVIEENVGKYMARMFPKYLRGKPSGLSLTGKLRYRLDGLRHRKDLSAKVLKELGEIKEPALPTALRVKEISGTLANKRLFDEVSKNPEWVAKTNTTGNLVKLPDVKTLGALQNKWVIKEIADDVNGMLQASKVSQEVMAKVGNLYSKGLSAWKYSKVVLNPATHSRNIISNSMLLDLSGTGHIRQAQLFPSVIKDYMSKGPLYQRALKNGGIGGEWVGSEVAKIKDFYTMGQGGNLSKWLNVLKAPFKKASNIYQGEEQVAKLIKFADMISKGASDKIAAREAQKWLFNYNKIPDIIKVAKHVSPFITFTYKSIPRIAEAIATNPMRVYKYYAFFNAFNSASAKLQGMSPEEFAREKKALPPWLMRSIGGMPSNLLFPWKDKYNRTQWLNLEYMLPTGMAPEVMRGHIISNPLITITAELMKNKDFKGLPIVLEGMNKGEAISAVANHVYRQVAPSLAPGLKGVKGWSGGYSFAKVMNAFDKIPDRAERIRSVRSSLFDVLLGLKITPLDIDKSETFKMYNKKRRIEDIQKQVLKLDHPAISESYRDKQMEILFQRQQRILEE